MTALLSGMTELLLGMTAMARRAVMVLLVCCPAVALLPASQIGLQPNEYVRWQLLF